MRACVPMNISFFKYDWKKEIWNLFFVGGILIGGIITAFFLSNPNPVVIDPKLATELAGYGITNTEGLVPKELFNWENLLTIKGLILIVAVAFLLVLAPAMPADVQVVIPLWGSAIFNYLL
jgi:hypothetical protein